MHPAIRMASPDDLLTARVREFAVRVLRFVLSLPQDPRTNGLLHRLVDTASAESANYRTARRARSRKEYIARMERVAQQADETAHWLDVLTTAGAIKSETGVQELDYLLTESRELRAIFIAAARAGHARSALSIGHPETSLDP